MRFYTTLSIRSAWTPQDLAIYDLGEVTPEELAAKLSEFTSNKTLVVNISLWNEKRRDEIVAEQ